MSVTNATPAQQATIGVRRDAARRLCTVDAGDVFVIKVFETANSAV